MLALSGLRHHRAAPVFWALFALGLILRAALLNQDGTSDILTDLQWGREANALGLPWSYAGDYFPLQYQVFQVVEALPSSLLAFKTVNLVAELGVFFLLIVLLRRWGLNPAYAFVFWLHPYFLEMFWLGYIDVQFAFFVLLGILALTRATSLRGFLIAGIPFAVAWQLKPQPVIGAVMIALFVLALAVQTLVTRSGPAAWRAARLSALFVAPAILWVGYEVWFTAVTGEPTRLPLRTYHGIVDFMPVLTAQMLNIWYPVAEYYRDGSEVNFGVEGPDSLHTLAKAITAVLLVSAVAVVWRFCRSRQDAVVVLLLFGFGAAILPMTMTRAHENHFYLAAVLLVPICAVFRTKRLDRLVGAFLLVQFVNLFGLYRFGDNDISKLQPFAKLHDWYTYAVQDALAFISVGLFVAMIVVVARLMGAARQPAGHQESFTAREEVMGV